jgi:hypothetical protein
VRAGAVQVSSTPGSSPAGTCASAAAAASPTLACPALPSCCLRVAFVASSFLERSGALTVCFWARSVWSALAVCVAVFFVAPHLPKLARKHNPFYPLGERLKKEKPHAEDDPPIKKLE